MRIAVFHDYLNQFGGAERVLKSILELFPDADLYTLLYDEGKTRGLFSGKNIYTSFLDVGFVRRRHRMFIPLMPFAAELMRINGPYDLVISSSAGYAKGFGRAHRDGDCNPFHICYCHSPLRYAWEIDYLKNLSFSPRPMSKDFLRPVARWLRNWDIKASHKANVFVANSRFIAEKVRSYYGRDAEVVYPPVSSSVFFTERSKNPAPYYLMAGRLLYYKGFDLGIKAFNKLKIPLRIVGRGPEEKKLKRIADPSFITFVPWVDDNGLRRLYSNARGFIFPQIEDFGLVAAEAQMCGLPVLSFNRGGGAEIVEDKKTGILFSEQTPEAIIDAVREFENMYMNREYIARRARSLFSEDAFKSGMRGIIKHSGYRL